MNLDRDYSGLRKHAAYRAVDTATQVRDTRVEMQAAQLIAASNLAVAEAIHRLADLYRDHR